jgi:hypothetical protein
MPEEIKEVCCQDCMHHAVEGFDVCLLHVGSEEERNVVTGGIRPRKHQVCKVAHKPGNGMSCAEFSPNKDCLKDKVV